MDVSARAASSMASGLCSACMRFTSTGANESTESVMRDSSEEMTSTSQSSFRAAIWRMSSPSALRPTKICFSFPLTCPALGRRSSSPPPRRRRRA